jgi:hypothetical protein
MVRKAVLRVTVALTLLLGVAACVTGVAHLWLHAKTSTVGTAVNVARVGYDLLVMGIICRAALFRVPEPTTEATS